MEKPCKECPFRRDSMKGYLGNASYQPEDFLSTIEHAPIPCHMTVDWEEDDEETIKDKSWSTPCRGSLRFLNNSLKLPRDPEYANLTRISCKDKNVFQWKHEFIKHHSKEPLTP
jgi:hypothetical protein